MHGAELKNRYTLKKALKYVHLLLGKNINEGPNPVFIEMLNKLKRFIFQFMLFNYLFYLLVILFKNTETILLNFYFAGNSYTS